MSPEWTPQLPGISLPEMGKSAISVSARATIEQLEKDGLLEPRHALTVQLVLELAAAVDRGLGWGKVSVATTTLVKELRELIASLPAPDDAAGSEWDELQAILAEAAAAEQGTREDRE